jgi:hypothetical protein
MWWWCCVVPAVWTSIALAALASPFLSTVYALTGYGRALSSAPAVRYWSVPKAYFTHFYVLGSVCNAVALALFLRWDPSALAGSVEGWESGPVLTLALAAHRLLPCGHYVLAAGALYQLHLARRVVECLCVHKFSPAARMPLVVYLGGMAHYALAPLSLFTATGSDLVSPSGSEPPGLEAAFPRGLPTLHPVVGTGAVLFLGGSAMQAWCHVHLASLRRGKAAGSDCGSLVGRGNSGSNTSTNNTSTNTSNGGGMEAGHAREDMMCSPGGSRAVAGVPRALRQRRGTALGAGGPVGKDADGCSAHGGGGSLSGNVTTAATTTTTTPATTTPATTTTSTTSGDVASYGVPSAWPFTVVACPHYTAEIVVYVGLWLVCVGHALALLQGGPQQVGAEQGSSGSTLGWLALLPWAAPTPLAMLSWSAVNLCVSGRRTLRWYWDQGTSGPGFPPRHAVLPGLL